jgi:hypothetical protein
VDTCILPFTTFLRDVSWRLTRKSLLMLMFIVSWFAIEVGGAAEPTSAESLEYSIKAAFLFKFGTFVEWPPDAFPSAEAPFTIGIVGDDPFGATLDNTIKGHSIGNRKIVVVRANHVEQISGEQILFISQSEKDRLTSFSEKLNGRKVLSVAEFDHPDIIVHLVLENDKVRFDINLDAANRAGIKLSSKLLDVARTVGKK